jgi:hypothetical protein
MVRSDKHFKRVIGSDLIDQTAGRALERKTRWRNQWIESIVNERKIWNALKNVLEKLAQQRDDSKRS